MGVIAEGASMQPSKDICSRRYLCDIAHSIVDGRTMPVGIHRRACILRNNDAEPFVGGSARRMLDTHVRPSAAVDDRVDPSVTQIAFEAGRFPSTHRHLFND